MCLNLCVYTCLYVQVFLIFRFSSAPIPVIFSFSHSCYVHCSPARHTHRPRVPLHSVSVTSRPTHSVVVVVVVLTTTRRRRVLRADTRDRRCALVSKIIVSCFDLTFNQVISICDLSSFRFCRQLECKGQEEEDNWHWSHSSLAHCASSFPQRIPSRSPIRPEGQAGRCV